MFALLFALLLDVCTELGGVFVALGLVAFALGWPVMAGPSWRWM